MFGKLKCILGIHDYETLAEIEAPVDLEAFRENPARFFAEYTSMRCRRCGYQFPKDGEPCQGGIKTRLKERSSTTESSTHSLKPMSNG